MIQLNKEQLLDRIRNHGFKTAIIYDQIIHTVRTDLPNFEKFACKSSDELLGLMETFCDGYSGIFSILMRTSDGGQNAGSTLVRVNLNPTQQDSTNQPVTVVNGQHETPKQMEERIIASVKTAMQVQSIEARENALNAEKMELATAGGRLTYIAEQWVRAKMGMTMDAPPTMNGAETKDKSDMSDEEIKEEITAAVKKLGDTLGVDTMIRLAAKLKPGDPVIQMVKDYANK